MIHNLTLCLVWGWCTLTGQLLSFKNHLRYNHETFSWWKDLVTNIFKFPPRVTSDHAEMVYFSGQSKFTDQGI